MSRIPTTVAYRTPHSTVPTHRKRLPSSAGLPAAVAPATRWTPRGAERHLELRAPPFGTQKVLTILDEDETSVVEFSCLREDSLTKDGR